MAKWILTLALLLPTLALAAESKTMAAEKAPTVELQGVISGAVCGIHGMLCTHEPDPERHYELLGLYTEPGGFYFLINVPPSVLRQINRQEVQVTGEEYKDYHALFVHQLRVGDRVVFRAEE